MSDFRVANLWRRNGWYYVATKYYAPGKLHPTKSVTVCRYLGFISYHGIRLIHGERKLFEMAIAEPKRKWDEVLFVGEA